MSLCFRGKEKKNNDILYIKPTRFFPNSCKDDQTSADAKEAGKATGAMSYALTSNKYKDIVYALRKLT